MQETVRQFSIELDYDPDRRVWFVADSELPELVQEDVVPGRVVSRLMAAGTELFKLNREKAGWPHFPAPGVPERHRDRRASLKTSTASSQRWPMSNSRAV